MTSICQEPSSLCSTLATIAGLVAEKLLFSLPRSSIRRLVYAETARPRRKRTSDRRHAVADSRKAKSAGTRLWENRIIRRFQGSVRFISRLGGCLSRLDYLSRWRSELFAGKGRRNVEAPASSGNVGASSMAKVNAPISTFHRRIHRANKQTTHRDRSR